MSTFFVILAIVMHEVPVYQNITQLLIRKNRVDFLLTELTQILEMSNVNITSLHLEHQNPAYVDVQISLDAQELKHLLPTLRRFGYEVLSKHPEDDLEEKLRVNSSYLDKYLSI